MSFTPMTIQGAWVHSPNVFSDQRGTFKELFKLSLLNDQLGRGFEVHQVNQSVSAKGVIRGVHWTVGARGQAKYVSCTEGKIWDIVIDLRRNSPTFGQWDAEFLSPENGKSVLISEGLGHAFLALEDQSAATYLCSAEFEPELDRNFYPLSPDLAIPFAEIGAEYGISNFQLSDKDASAPLLLSEIGRDDLIN
jgi:dTDP-4-dehydrorhamnose 3,5-epimerase